PRGQHTRYNALLMHIESATSRMDEVHDRSPSLSNWRRRSAEGRTQISPTCSSHMGMATLINLWMRFWTAFGSGSQHQFRASYCRRHSETTAEFHSHARPRGHAASGEADVKPLPVGD